MAHKKETDKGSRHRLTPLDEGGWHRARKAYPEQASPQLPQINTRDMDAVTPCIGVSRREYALAGSSIGECRCGIKEASGSCKILSTCCPCFLTTAGQRGESGRGQRAIAKQRRVILCMA